jgi:hypothetical protein
MRLMYWYSLTPVVIVFGGLVFLTIPFLALAVLTIVSLGALAGLAWAIVALPYMLGHAISRRWHGHGAGPRTAVALHVYPPPRVRPAAADRLQRAGGREGAPSQRTFREEYLS